MLKNMSEMLVAICLVYSTSGITCVKIFCRELKIAAILKNWNIEHSFNLTSDMKRSSQIMPKKYLHDVDVIDDVTGWPQISLYIHVKERLAPGANCKGNVSSINANIIIVFLGYTCQTTISMNNTFRDCRSMVNITGLLGDLGTNKQHCKLSQMQL